MRPQLCAKPVSLGAERTLLHRSPKVSHGNVKDKKSLFSFFFNWEYNTSKRWISTTSGYIFFNLGTWHGIVEGSDATVIVGRWREVRQGSANVNGYISSFTTVLADVGRTTSVRVPEWKIDWRKSNNVFPCANFPTLTNPRTPIKGSDIRRRWGGGGLIRIWWQLIYDTFYQGWKQFKSILY